MAINLTPVHPRHLNVNEIFGPTVQGEGPTAGQLCGFLRLAGCNLACVWCDTPYSWDWERYDKPEESHPMTVMDVANEVNRLPIRRLVISGGEPMLQQPGLIELRPLLKTLHIEVETNGTRPPRAEMLQMVERFNVSPKLAHSGDTEEARLPHDSIASFAHLALLGRATFKFVAATEADLDEVAELVKRFEIPQRSIWIMPEGYTKEQHLKHLEAIADPVIDRGWNLTTRLHVLAFETIRRR